MDDEMVDAGSDDGLSRRSLLRRGAVVGGALVWTTPIVQAVGVRAAGAQVPTPDTPGEECVFHTAVFKLDLDENRVELTNTGGGGCSVDCEPDTSSEAQHVVDLFLSYECNGTTNRARILAAQAGQNLELCVPDGDEHCRIVAAQAKGGNTDAGHGGDGCGPASGEAGPGETLVIPPPPETGGGQDAGFSYVLVCVECCIIPDAH